MSRAAAERAEQGVYIYAMGVGTTDGAPIPLEGGGFQKYAAGQVVLSRLDEDLLKELARIGGGAYVRSSASAADIRAIYEGEIRPRLQGAEQGVRRDRIWNEYYQWPLGLAVLLVVLGSAVSGPAAAVPPGAPRLRWCPLRPSPRGLAVASDRVAELGLGREPRGPAHRGRSQAAPCSRPGLQPRP